jgi:hypothetical protein
VTVGDFELFGQAVRVSDVIHIGVHERCVDLRAAARSLAE